ncbi:unnamed protein product [Closterium sp. NIES-53]
MTCSSRCGRNDVEPSGPYPELVGCLILGSGSVSWRSTRSSSVLGSSCEAEIYAGAMAAEELRWLTYLLTDLGEPPRSPPQRGQLRLAYVASEANTADIFTKALPPGDHQCFCTMLACFALLDWSCDLLFSPTLPMGPEFETLLVEPDDLIAKITGDTKIPLLNTHEESRATADKFTHPFFPTHAIRDHHGMTAIITMADALHIIDNQPITQLLIDFHNM